MLKIIFFPFYLIWAFVGFLFGLLGSILSAVLGFVFLLVGVILTATVIGAIVGIPLIILGGTLCVRSLF